MEEGAVLISEVVVTGTGVATDRRRTAISVEAISSDELPAVSSGSVDQALVGKIPGAYIQQSSGQPGQQANIILRGINSLGGTTPMILIDGVQVSTDNNFNGSNNTLTSRLADIDFSNVERIEVVQGAAAATIYGAQGANGVIQIFTKKGSKGKPRISLSSSYSVANPMKGGFEYAQLHAYQTLPDGRITSGGGTPLQQNEFGVWSAPLLEADADSKTDNTYVEQTYDLFDQIFQDNIPNYNSVNPLFTEIYRRRTANLMRILPNINLNWKVADFLELDYKYGIDHYRDDFQDFIDNQSQILGTSSQGGIDPIVGQIDQRLREGTLQNSLLSGFLRFGDDAGLESTSQISFDWRKRDFSFVRATGTGLPLYEPVTLRAAEQSNIDEFIEEFTTYGFLINEKIEYQGKVGVSGGLRIDWSSVFGQGSAPFVFPRGDVYLRLSEFDFWNMKASIPEFKLRAAYGQAGVQPGAFDRIVTLNAGQLGTGGYLAPRQDQTNPLLDVQVSKEFEAGFDVSFTPGNRNSGIFSFLGLSLTYWDRTSEDVIREIGVAPTTGATTILDNAITLESNGWQISLDKSIFESSNFSWKWTTNFGRQQTTLVSISNNVDIPASACATPVLLLTLPRSLA